MPPPSKLLASLAQRVRPPRGTALRLPRRTVRLRLTGLYGALFLLSGAGLLAITYLLVNRSSRSAVYFSNTVSGGGPSSGGSAGAQVGGALPGLRIEGQPPGVAGPLPSTPQQARALSHQLSVQASNQHAAEMHHLLIQSGIALAIMSVVSIALGWMISGRVLRPLRTMTAATRRISEDNLHERLALQGPNDELRDLADTIDGLLSRLEAAFEAQRRFVANASHELRTPLAMMRTSLDVAVAKPESAPAQIGTLEGKLREGLDQADRLLESFLVLARAQHGALADEATVSLPQLFASAIETRGAALAAKDIDVRETFGAVSVKGSETLLSRMVENVVENAICHNEERGWLRVTTEVDGAVARLVVESGGAQLDEAKVRELAQPFRRLGAERIGSENGVGLGLSIVAAIAAAHGGALELAALAHGGLRVQIELPHVAHAPPVGAPA